MIMNAAVVKTVLLLLLGCTSLTLSAECPQKENIEPCTCSDDKRKYDTDLYLECVSLESSEELRKVLSFFDKESVLAVTLLTSKVTNLPSDAFKGFKVQRLVLSGMNSLAEEGSVPFSGLEDTLELLSVVHSFSKNDSPKKLDISHLRSLTSLDVTYNTLSNVGNDFFENGPTTLTSVVFHGNGIEELGNKAFSELANLESLWLNGNKFGKLQRSILPKPAKTLRYLQFQSNSLTSLPEDMFSDMPQLNSVSFEDNSLETVEQKTFQPIWAGLQLLDIRENPIRCDSNLKWMADVKSFAVVLGTCASPPDKKGMDIERFLSTK